MAAVRTGGGHAHFRARGRGKSFRGRFGQFGRRNYSNESIRQRKLSEMAYIQLLYIANCIVNYVKYGPKYVPYTEIPMMIKMMMMIKKLHAYDYS